MIPTLVAIAGGTGSGKSTLCYSLEKKFPIQIQVIHFDDYHKKSEDIPIHFGMQNWDHPDAINFNLLRNDLIRLKSSKQITIQTKDRTINPNYKYTKARIPIKIKPKGIILIEGFMVLFDPKSREMYDETLFLKLDHQTRLKRRTKFLDIEYEKRILIPMHEKYVESTTNFAEHIINVTNLSEKQLLSKVEKILGLTKAPIRDGPGKA